MQKYKKDFITYLFCVFLSLGLLFWIIPNNMPEYPGYGMPASFLPNLASSIILVLSLLSMLGTYIKYKKEIVSNHQEQAEQDKEEVKEASLGWKKFILPILFICAIAFLLLLPRIGFILSSSLLLLALQLICGQRSIVAIILTTTLPVAVTYSLMKFVLSVPIP